MELCLKLRQASELTLQSADDVWRIWCDAYSVAVVLDGQGEAAVDGRLAVVQQGDVLCCNPESVLELKAAHHRHLVLALVDFYILLPDGRSQDGLLLYRESRSAVLETSEHARQNSYRISEIARQLKELTGGGSYNRLSAPGMEARRHSGGDAPAQNASPDSAALRAGMLLHELLQLALPGRTQPEARPHWVDAVTGYMREHYREDITRDAMARMAGFHPRFFSSLFKQATGCGFSEYLAGIRINQAKEQLLLTDKNLSDIAQDVGYANGVYLSRKFKQVVGVSPKAYTQQPKCVVVYDWVGNALALGVKPVGASYPFGLRGLHLLKPQLDGVADVGRSSVEAVVRLQPELIVAPSWLGADMIGRLRRVAPTLSVPYGDPFERLQQLAAALSRREQAAQFIERYKAKLKETSDVFRAAVQPGESVGLYELAPSGHIWVMNEFHGRGGYNLFCGLKLAPPGPIAKQVMGKGMIRQIPLERLPEYAADHMFIGYPFQPESAEWTEAVMRHDVWRQLAAYRRDRIYMYNQRVFHPVDVYSLLLQLELQQQLLSDPGCRYGQSYTFVHKTSDI